MKTWVRRTMGLILLATVCVVATITTISGCRVDYTNGSSSGGTDFLATGNTRSFFTATQVDPQSEDSAGPQFTVAEDLNGDGLVDLVSAWNQSQPLQIHLQGRTADNRISFETVTLAGSIPVLAVSGLAVTDFDQDGRPDIVVMVKESGLPDPGCLDSEQPTDGVLSGIMLLYMGPTDPTQANQSLAWEEIPLEASRLAGNGSSAGPAEEGGFTNMAIGDVDNDGDIDIVTTWNSGCGLQTAEVLVFTNGGAGAVRDGNWTAATIPDQFPASKGTRVKDVKLGDIDRDGDLDIVATFPDATSLNLRWYRNPFLDVPDDFHISDGSWQTGTVAQIAPDAGMGPDTIRVGDIDRDGILDVVVRSSAGRVIQWLKGPEGPTTSPVRSIPWQVFTLAEFTDRTPEAITLGDINGDGQFELIVSAEGGLAWFDSQAAPTVFDQWLENLIVDDRSTGSGDNDPATTDPNVSPSEIAGGTLINSILVVDLDGDGSNDLITPLDRSGLSGLTNDAIVWFRNTQ